MLRHLRELLRNPQRGILIVSSLILLIGACSFGGPLRVDRSANNYTFPDPPVGWTRVVNPEVDADKLYQHSATGAVLSVSSICERYEEASLDSLARSALSPIGIYTEKERKTYNLDGREALELLVQGKVDGVPAEVNIVVLRKNDCLFDFSLQAVPKIQSKVRSEFLGLVKGFRYKTGR